MKSPKVVGVGFQKTGTSSLGLALEHLGYTVASYDQFRDLVDLPAASIPEAVDKRARELILRYDAFKDTPWPVLYRDLDVWMPGTKFILVRRDPDKWIQSVVKDFGSFPNSVHRWIYGVDFPLGHEQIFVDRYVAHCREVKEYFDGRPDSLLELNLDQGEVGWEPICEFLGLPAPDLPWPHANTHAQKQKLMRRTRLLRRAKRALGLGISAPRDKASGGSNAK